MALRRISFFLLAALFLAGCNKPADGGSTAAGGTTVAAPAEATLRLKANKGDKFTMVMEMDTKAEIAPQPGLPPGPHTMKMSMIREHTCLDTSNGKMKWELKTLDASGTGTGALESEVSQLAEKEKGKTSTELKDERNRVVETSEESPFSLVYPEAAVKPGDTWDAETKLLGQSMKVTFKLDRFEQINGKNAAVITASFPDTENLKMVKPLVLYVDMANGWPIKGDGEFEMVPQPNSKLFLTARLRVK